MSELDEAIALIQRQVRVPNAGCAIANSDCNMEASLMGTRDGYLNLALAILGFVADADQGRCRDEENKEWHWDDRIKSAIHLLPISDPIWLVGMYLFLSHNEFVTRLNEVMKHQLSGHSLLQNPHFADPGFCESNS